MELYSYVPPPGSNIPIYVDPFPVDASVPTDDKIEWAVKRLQNHRSGGPSGMQSEHLKGWLATSRKKDNKEAATGEETTENKRGGGYMESTSTEASKWEIVVELVQTVFR